MEGNRGGSLPWPPSVPDRVQLEVRNDTSPSSTAPSGSSAKPHAISLTSNGNIGIAMAETQSDRNQALSPETKQEDAPWQKSAKSLGEILFLTGISWSGTPSISPGFV